MANVDPEKEHIDNDDETSQNLDDEQDESTEDDGEKIDWKQVSRKHERTAKKWQKENTKLTEQLNEIQKKFDELNQRTEINNTRAEIANEFGLPQKFIKGSTADEMRAYAQELADYLKPKSVPKMPKSGTFDRDQNGLTDKQELAKQLFNSIERN